MSGNRGNLRNAFCLSLCIAFIAIVFAGIGNGQEKEPVVASLGPLQSNGNEYNTPYYEFWTYTYSVPAGKRLVIEQVFFEVLASQTGLKAQARIKVATYQSTTLVGTRYYPIQLTNISNSDETILSTSQLTKLYITNPSASGKTVKVSFLLIPSNPTIKFLSQGDSAISGYLEDAP